MSGTTPSAATPTGASSGATPSGAPKPSELVFGRYQIIRRLAVGGMGEVFLARQSGVAGFDRLVILKSLLPDLAQQEDFVHQFLDEARVAATLNHPNIVSIYEVGLWNGTYFIAMEYIKGDNLSRLARVSDRAKRRVPTEVAAYIIHDAALALDHAHKATDLQGKPLSIVHRDVSPQNIMVRTDGVTKVVDFGIAKAANRSSRTATGLLKGKVQYMAPEQVSGAELDGRADQFALGVVLWEMVAGRKLFTGSSDIDVLKSVLYQTIDPLASIDAEVNAALGNCVDRMLQRNRDARYPSLAEAAHDLKKYLDVVGIKNAQQRTAEFVADMLGDEIASKTVDLTPSGASNFVINLAPPTAPTTMTPGRLPRAPVAIFAGLALAVMVGIVGALVIFWDRPPVERPIVNRVAEPPVVQNPKVAVASTPAGAEVFLDGKSIGNAPLTLDFAADTDHVVELALTGYEREKTTHNLKAGAFEPLMITLKKLPLTVKIESEPRGAEVSEGKVSLGKTPLTITLPADAPHDLRLWLEQGRKKLGATLSINGKPGDSITKSVRLKEVREKQAPAEAAQPVEKPKGEDGFVTVNTKPWTKIFIDGAPYGSTPIANVKLAPGKHTVALVNEEQGVNEKRSITIEPGKKAKFDWKLK